MGVATPSSSGACWEEELRWRVVPCAVTPRACADVGLLSPALRPSRDVPDAPEEEEEESQGPPREQDLKEAYIQLVQGMQEWPDGCVYRGDFGLDTKLGHGEFSWPTGEVSGFQGSLPPVWAQPATLALFLPLLLLLF